MQIVLVVVCFVNGVVYSLVTAIAKKITELKDKNCVHKLAEMNSRE